MKKFFSVYGVLTAGLIIILAVTCFAGFEQAQAKTFAYVALIGAVTFWSVFVGSTTYGSTKVLAVEVCFITLVHLVLGVGLLFFALQILYTSGIPKVILITAVITAVMFYLAAAYGIVRLWILQFCNPAPKESD